MAEELEITFDLSNEPQFDALFEINASGTVWGSIDGDIENQTDLKNALDELDLAISANHQEIGNIGQTLGTYGDIVTHDVSEFATSAQGALADTALQPNDNITELTNNAGYITSSALTDYVPTSRTINSKALTSNITLSASDVNALSSSTTIDDLTTSAQQAALNSGATTTNIGQITTNTNNITAINNKIPSDASSSNQLADKNYVDTADGGLQSQINDLKARGRFLALWNSATGLAETNPPQSPYTYQAGDYFIIGVISTATPAVNYKPTGSSYTTGVASTVVETEVVDIDDVYYYDGTTWKLQVNTQKTTSFVNIAGSPYDNTNLATALNAKENTISDLATIRSGAALGATSLQPNDNITSLTNNAGYITGITSSDVTTALGYTPYDSSNPSGYTSNVGTVTSVNSISPVSGNVTLSIPTATSDLTNDSGYIVNTATGSNSLTIDGDATTYTRAINIGYGSQARNYGTRVGYGGYANGTYSTALGYNATCTTTATNSIQLGPGSVSNTNSFNVGFQGGSNYQLLDGTTGLIPNARLNSDVLHNTATGTGSLTINGTVATSSNSVNIGNSSSVTATNGVALGVYASAQGVGATAIGTGARSLDRRAIQIGIGDNGTANTLSVGFDDANYQLLDGTTGLIPDARISSNIARTSAVPAKTSDLTNDSGYITSSDIDQSYDDDSTNAQSGTAVAEAVTEAESNAATYSDILIPDTTNMPVLKTFEYDIPSKAWYSFASIANDTTDFKDYKLSTLFRMTITGTNIETILEVLISYRGLANAAIITPFLVVRNVSLDYTNAGSGLNAIRITMPKVLNNQYNSYFELYPFDATARHVKIEVLKDNNRIVWSNSLNATNYSSSYYGATNLNVGTAQGPLMNVQLPITVSSAQNAGYSSNFYSKMGTIDFTAGEALDQGFTFLSNTKVYMATNTTEPIDTAWGLSVMPTTLVIDATVTYTNYRQKCSLTSSTATLPPHDNFNLGDNLYLRCNLVNGQIYSDNYIATSTSAGYTWYFLGTISRTANGVISVDTTHSYFFTLDSNGKLTHINGKEIITPSTSNFADTSLSNLTNGLSNTICTIPATTITSASSATPAVVVENYVNGTSWYRVWSDGWCEQGGRATGDTNSNPTISFLKTMADTNYHICTESSVSGTGNTQWSRPINISTTGFSIAYDYSNGSFIPSYTTCWRVEGYIA